jgi:hypothetical protein
MSLETERRMSPHLNRCQPRPFETTAASLHPPIAGSCEETRQTVPLRPRRDLVDVDARQVLTDDEIAYLGRVAEEHDLIEVTVPDHPEDE